MSKRVFWLPVILLSVIHSFGARTQYEALPDTLDGSMMPYDFSLESPALVIPDTLKPVYVGYVARHGARYLSSAGKLKALDKAIAEAREAGVLSKHGEEFARLLDQVRSVSDTVWGLLSPVGIAEQQRLGDYVARQFPSLFGNGRVEAISTFVPRVIMTMDQFIHAMERHDESMQISTGSGTRFNPLLYCFEANEVYARYRADGKWKEVYEPYMKEVVSPEPARRLFKKSDFKSDKKLRELTNNMYGVLQGLRASGMNPPTTQWMSVEEYRGCWLASNAVHWLRNTINPVSGVAGPATALLLNTIINRADMAITNDDNNSRFATGDKGGTQGFVNGDNVVFDGYFGHAETLMPLLSLMDIKGYSAQQGKLSNLISEWQVNKVVPLGANIMLALMRADSGEVYCALRVNGRDVCPLDDDRVIVPWRDLKAFWLLQIATTAFE